MMRLTSGVAASSASTAVGMVVSKVLHGRSVNSGVKLNVVQNIGK